MKNIFFLLILCFSNGAYSQSYEQNRFNDSGYGTDNQDLSDIDGEGQEPESVGNPGDEVPIDDYLPYLFIAGLTLAAYFVDKNKKMIKV